MRFLPLLNPFKVIESIFYRFCYFIQVLVKHMLQDTATKTHCVVSVKSAFQNRQEMPTCCHVVPPIPAVSSTTPSTSGALSASNSYSKNQLKLNSQKIYKSRISRWQMHSLSFSLTEMKFGSSETTNTINWEHRNSYFHFILIFLQVYRQTRQVKHKSQTNSGRKKFCNYFQSLTSISMQLIQSTSFRTPKISEISYSFDQFREIRPCVNQMWILSNFCFDFNTSSQFLIYFIFSQTFNICLKINKLNK